MTVESPSVESKIEEALHEAPPGSDGPRTNIALWGFLALVLMTAIGVVPRLIQRASLNAAAAEARAQKPTVSVGHASPAPDSGVNLPANIQAITQTTINARTTGYVRQRSVDIGDRVHRGQLLAIIGAPDVDQQYFQASADAERANASASGAEADVAKQRATLGQASAQVSAAAAQVAQAQANRAAAAARLAQSQHNLRGYQANLDKAKSQLVLAEKTWMRYRELVHQGFVTLQDYDQTKTSYETNVASVEAARTAVESGRADVEAARMSLNAAEASVLSAQASLAAAQQTVMANQAGVRSSEASLRAARAGEASGEANRERYDVMRGFERVMAPFDGVITARDVDDGTLVKADNVGVGSNTPGLFGIARTDVLRIMVNVPQTFLPYLRMNDDAQLKVQEFPDRTFTGHVFRISGGLDPTSRTILTEVHVENKDGTLLPGMYVEVKLGGDNAERPLRIPASALISDAKGTRVATIAAGDKVHFVKVGIDRDLGSEIQISTGLTAADVIVTNPSDALQEGTPVAILAPKSPEAGAAPESPAAK